MVFIYSLIVFSVLAICVGVAIVFFLYKKSKVKNSFQLTSYSTEELVSFLLSFGQKEGWELKENTVIDSNRSLIFYIKQKQLSGFFSTSAAPNKITILITSSNGKLLVKCRSELFGKRFVINLWIMPLWGIILWAKDMAFIRKNLMKLADFLNNLSGGDKINKDL